MSYEPDGIRVERQIVAPGTIADIRRGIFEIMRPHCQMDPNDPLAIDKGFVELGTKSPELKRNCYRMFGKLTAIPRSLSDPGMARIIEELGFSDSTIQSFSVFCLEPGNKRNTFLPHQDLRDRTSLRSLLIWLPLSAGRNLGGMICYAGTHRGGPIQHSLTESGKPFVEESHFRSWPRMDVVDFKLGDVVFMDPYLVHESVANTGNGVRWTAVIKLDSIRNLGHLDQSPYPFPIERYIDLRSNEARLKAN